MVDFDRTDELPEGIYAVITDDGERIRHLFSSKPCDDWEVVRRAMSQCAKDYAEGIWSRSSE